jgi:hypothetical protein
MLGPPEMETAPWRSAAAVKISNATPYRNAGPSSTEIAVADAVRCVCGANRLLMEAAFRLDEGGYVCEALHDISASTAALVAEMHGRPSVTCNVESEPAYIAESAAAWRAERDRRARR